MRLSTAVVILCLAAGVAPSVALPLPTVKYASLLKLLHLRMLTFYPSLHCRSGGADVNLNMLNKPRSLSPHLYPPSPPHEVPLPPSHPPPHEVPLPPSPSHPPPPPPSHLHHPKPLYAYAPPVTHLFGDRLPPDGRFLTEDGLSLLSEADLRIKPAARAYVRELLTTPMDDL